MEKISVDHRSMEIHIVGKKAALPVKGKIAVIVIGVKLNRQVLKGKKVSPKQIGIAGEQCAVLLILPAESFHIGQVEGLGHQLQQFLLKKAPAVKRQEAGIGHPVVAFGKEKIAGGLQLLLRGQSGRLERQGVGPLGVRRLSQLRQPAGDFDRIHRKTSRSASIPARGQRPPRLKNGGRALSPAPCGRCSRTTARDHCSNCSTPWGT